VNCNYKGHMGFPCLHHSCLRFVQVRSLGRIAIDPSRPLAELLRWGLKALVY